MATTYYTLKSLTDFINKHENINQLKITNFWFGSFNQMEGYQYRFNVKVSFDDKETTRIIKVWTNSTWLEDIEGEINANSVRLHLMQYVTDWDGDFN